MSTKERTKVVIDRTKWMRIVRREENDYRATRYALDGTTPRVLDAMDAPSLLSRCGTMCCLGFISKTLLADVCSQEVIDRLLLETGTPASILRKSAYSTDPGCNIELKKLVEALGPLLKYERISHLAPHADPRSNELIDQRTSSLADEAMHLNDLVDITGELCDQAVKTREEKLVTMFAAYGIDLEFVGEKDPHEIQSCDSEGEMGSPDLRPDNERPAEL